MRVVNKIVVVTGAGNGIGRELTILLLKKGARVAAIDISLPDLLEIQKICKDFGNKLSIHQSDISIFENAEKLFNEAVAHHGTIDALINNAGIIQPFVKVNKLSIEAAKKVMDVNFYGTFYLTKIFLPHLLTRPVAHIVNISSMGGFLPVPGQTVYGASKAAVKLFTEGLRSELLSTNVKVTIVFPGAVGTNIAQNSGVEVDITNNQKSKYKTLPAAKAAEQIVEGIERDAYRVLVGSDAKFMDFIYRLHPKFAAEFIFKQMKNLLLD